MTEVLHVILVLDETGSMQSIKEQTLSGLNEYIQTLQNDKEHSYKMSLVMFNSNALSMVFRDRDINTVYKFTDEHYHPNYMTPLYDAVAWAINNVETNDNVLLVILTDGYENASKEYTLDSISKLLDTKRKDGWQIIFLGADQDAWGLTGASIGFTKGQTLSFDSEDIVVGMRTLATNTVSYVASGMTQTNNFFIDTDIRAIS